MIDRSVNEFLLWHGCDRDEWEGIIKNGFSHRQVEDNRGPYGAGAYFSDNFGGSWNGVTRPYILLCRVCCGDLYTTSQLGDFGAVDKAKRMGKDAILATPRDGGPKQVVVFSSRQVYPEFA